MGRVHVVGAGLAGLACAVRLATMRRHVVLYEAANHAGGRCRSFHDDTLDRSIANGSHLILSGNRATFHFLDAVGSRNSLLASRRAVFPFIDLATDQRWALTPNMGPIPWWILSPRRRVPNSRPGDYLGAVRLARARPQETVAQCLGGSGVLFDRFWAPLTIAALNTPPEEASAKLLWPVFAETFALGATRCRPFVARTGLSATFVAPAIARLRALGGEIHFAHRLRAVHTNGTRVERLDFAPRQVRLAEGDAAVLALPPMGISALLPDTLVPLGSHAIVNVHFRLDEQPRLDANSPFIGVIGGLSHWIFVRGDVAAVTVSAADELAEETSEDVAQQLWLETVQTLDLSRRNIPAFRVVKEKRATFAQTPESLAKRSGSRSAFSNLYLAGDWTNTGLPATIEGAIRSGFSAANLILDGRADWRSKGRVRERQS